MSAWELPGPAGKPRLGAAVSPAGALPLTELGAGARVASTAASMLSICSCGMLAMLFAMLRIISGDRSTPGGKPPFIRACLNKGAPSGKFKLPSHQLCAHEIQDCMSPTLCLKAQVA